MLARKKIVFLGKKKKAPALTHISNDCLSAFSQNNLYSSVIICVLCIFPISSHETFKKILNKIINFNLSQESFALSCHDLDL